jgi:L-fucose mutarotase
MLLGIDPLLNGDLLAALDHMGHGDALVVADRNFPAYRLGAEVVRLDAVDAVRALSAILTVFPVDAEASIALMAAGGERLAIQNELAAVASRDLVQVVELERSAFYEEASRASLVVLTGEPRPYGNVLIHKAAIPEGSLDN